MRILPDGTVEIINTRTKEPKIVKPADLPSYGIPYTAYEKELNAAKNIGVVNQENTAPVLSAAQQTQKDALKMALSALEGAGVNLEKSGGAKGVMGIPATLPFIGQYLDPSGASYHHTKVEIATQLAKAITGNSRPAITVIDKYLESLPDVTDTPTYAKKKSEKLKNELLTQAKTFKYNDLLQQFGDTSGNDVNSYIDKYFPK